jgi:hypothetical protein
MNPLKVAGGMPASPAENASVRVSNHLKSAIQHASGLVATALAMPLAVT